MIQHPAFPVEPWTVTETAYSPEILGQAESVFALSNGYLGLRGNLDEGDPVFLAGTYLNGFCESRPIIYGEYRHGFPRRSETLLNVTDGKLIRLRVNGMPLDVRTGRLHAHRRTLDLRTATLTRELVWSPPGGGRVAVTSQRLVSFHNKHLAAISYQVRPLDGPVALEICSLLVGNESNQASEGDPREAAPLYGQVLLPGSATVDGARAVLVHSTRASGLTVAAGADHVLQAAGPVSQSQGLADGGSAHVTFTLTATPESPVRLVKLLAYHWTAGNAAGELARQVHDTLGSATGLGYEGLAERQARLVAGFWERSDVTVEGDPEVQQGVRFGLLQLLQATAHAGARGVAAKGLTGQGYEGHRFWDAEIFLLPVLAYTSPQQARNLLTFRHATLPAARTRACELGLAGALFPWRTSPAPTSPHTSRPAPAAYHLTADIAYAVRVYLAATGDEEFAAGPGAELLVETARLWISLGHYDPARGGAFCLDQVTGPNEYTVLADNNVYTNLMAQANLSAAATICDHLQTDNPGAYHRLAAATGLKANETTAWRHAADAMRIPYDTDRGIHLQDETFLHQPAWDFGATPARDYPLLLHYHPLTLYRHQIVKQADLVLALHLAGGHFTPEQKQRDFAYYEPLTAHDSSLSASSHAVVAAELGDLTKAMRYLRATALLDLDDLNHNVRDGLHIAALASTWTCIITGLAGLRHTGGDISLAPRLPAGWEKITFPLTIRGQRIRIELTPATASYQLCTGDTLTIHHHGQPITLRGGEAVHVPLAG
ncbi:MAG: glycoside hydrolase family 65 protein [Micromonosporaceae bacterium]